MRRTASILGCLSVVVLAFAGSSPAPAATGDPALDAANGLIALPWGRIASEKGAEAVTEIEKALNGATLFRATKTGWSVKSSLENPSASVNIANAPGFTAASPTGFGLRVPLNGSWDMKAGAQLVTKIRIGNKSWSPSVHVGLRVNNFRINVGAELDATNPNRNPTLKSGSVRPTFSLAGEGALPVSLPVNLGFSFDKDKGGLASSSSFAVPLTIGGGFGARIEGSIDVSLTPISLGRFIDGELAEENVSFQRLSITLGGKVQLKLPSPVGNVTVGSASLTFNFPIPLWGDANGMIQMLEGSLPRSWGERKALGRTQPTTQTDFATTAKTLEAGIPAHTPFGAMLSIDRKLGNDGNPLPPGPGTTSYYLEADSSIWTGHYLAAESFRYATEHSADAHQRVTATLEGIDRLFWVTEDAVLQDGRYTPVKLDPNGGRLFSRTALRTTGALTDIGYRSGPLQRRGCAYIRPTGGWTVTTAGSTRTFATLAAAYKVIGAGQRGSVKPVPASQKNPLWVGFACGQGESNHPLSRDQYSGVLLGVALAYQLVDDPAVKAKARELFLKAFKELVLARNWNVVTAPENHVATSFLGNFEKQLAFLRVAATMDPAYANLYARYAAASKLVWLPVWFSSLDPLSKYFKFNLDHAVLVPTLLYETDPTLRANYMAAYMTVRRATAHHRNAYFNEARILVEPPATRAQVSNGASGSNPALALKDEIKATLGEWIERLGYSHFANGMPRLTAPKPEFQANLWPGQIQLYYTLGGQTLKTYKAIYALPVWGRLGRGMDFVWQRDPFFVAVDPNENDCKPPATVEMVKGKCGSNPGGEGPGVDYLLAYWLATYLGVLPH